MPITLSNGTYLEDTKQTDGRGYPIMIDGSGNLYTVQNGNVVLSRRATSYDPDEASGVLKSLAASGNTDLIAPYKALKQQFQATLPDPSLFDLPEFSQFEKQAGEEVGKFYIRDFEQLDKQFSTWRKQAETKRTQEKQRIAQDLSRDVRIEDREFANALETMQNGFSGRGTFTSGFRHGALSEQDKRREEELGIMKTGYERKEEDSTTGFSHLLENYNLQEESQRLALERRQEQDRLARARQLQEEELMRRQSAADAANENAAKLLNSGLSA